MNVWTWNVNSIRSKVHLVNTLLTKHNIDILLLTETKIKPSHEAELNKSIIPNYGVIWNSNKISYYHGIAVIYKKTINISLICDYLPRIATDIDMNLCCMKNSSKVKGGLNDQTKLIDDIANAHMKEGRILTLYCKPSCEGGTECTEFVLVGTYVPNSGVDRKVPLKRLAYRTLVWDKDLYKYLVILNQKYDKVIWLGDLNVAKSDNDMKSIKSNYAGTTPEERSNIQQFFTTNGWIDTWEYSNPTLQSYNERWTYGTDGNTKLRLDYIICSSGLEKCIKESHIDHKFEGSDHVPIGTTFVFN